MRYDEEQEMLRDLRNNPSSRDNSSGRRMEHGKDYGGSYRPDRENPPRGRGDTRDSE